jgi:uncharacterized protein YegL
MIRGRRGFALLAGLTVVTSVSLAATRRELADLNHEIDTANWIALPISSIDGFFPTPWQCPSGAPATQALIQFHENWHCANPDHSGANWGNRFFGFHKQFLLGYDRYLASIGEPHVQTWVAAPGALIPPAHGGRPANSPCNNCQALPSQFKLPAAGGTLDGFATVTAIGDAIVSWHNSNHSRIAQAGGTGGCSGGSADMNCPRVSTRDPIFYRYHHIFDDVQNAWRTFQTTDIAIVFDRSGSMSLSTAGGGTRLDAAKSAANMFADLLEDGSSQRLGMVSFSTTASAPADMALTSVGTAPGALSTALGAISAAGNTSIGDGLQKAATLVNAGSSKRKAILLLTDGMENTAPTIATAQGGLGDIHVCSVGFGTPGALDGPKLRDLSERQGGIYISTPNTLELKKFFVFCFADIFDSFVGADPIELLPASALASAPSVNTTYLDDKLAFVLSWTHPVPKGTIRLSITSPSGAPVNLADPSIESVYGPTWHIVRFNTPYRGEANGQWEARAVRQHRGFVNGFSSNAFANINQGAAVVLQEIARLCPDGCRRALYFEDEGAHDTFEDHNTIYTQALYSEAGGRLLGSVIRPRNPAEFLRAIREGGFDLLVYSSQVALANQPYDAALSNLLCSERKPRTIISDNRTTTGAASILRCAGALRGEQRNFTRIGTSQQLVPNEMILRRPEHVDVFSYQLNPTSANSLVQATSGGQIGAIIAQGVRGQDEQFFITTLTRGAGRVKAFTYRSWNYTFESLHPTFHIPEMYWPIGGYDPIEASVDVTRPTFSEGRLAAETGGREGTRINGDALSARQVAMARQAGTQVGGTETKTFPLYDDGTHGDGTANDRYWEISLPPDFAAYDGEYRFHAHFRLCKGTLCVTREAEQTVTVETTLSSRTTVRTERLPASGGRNVTRVFFTPVDRNGTPLGPGLVSSLRLSTTGDAKVEQKGDSNGRGEYQATVSWTASANTTAPTLLITQPGRPKDAISVDLTR